jgi:hypothetical protein
VGAAAGIAVGLVGAAAVIGVALSGGRATSMIQIIPVVNPAMLGHYNTWVPYSEPENVGTYEYQSVAEPMGAMGTNTAFMGTHDGVCFPPPCSVHRAAVEGNR